MDKTNLYILQDDVKEDYNETAFMTRHNNNNKLIILPEDKV